MIIEASKSVLLIIWKDICKKYSPELLWRKLFILDLWHCSASTIMLLAILNIFKICYDYSLMWKSFRWSYMAWSAKNYQSGIHHLPSAWALKSNESLLLTAVTVWPQSVGRHCHLYIFCRGHSVKQTCWYWRICWEQKQPKNVWLLLMKLIWFRKFFHYEKLFQLWENEGSISLIHN